MGILGPSQPYLAHTVGVTNKEINLVWTAMTGGSCLATIAVGAVFNVRVTPSSKIPPLIRDFLDPDQAAEAEAPVPILICRHLRRVCGPRGPDESILDSVAR